ncbi:MAG: arylsulfatase [Planctomycetaceae bacterium]|nr:arylsulfatase [Planctomycetaceae bacterium]
MSVANKSVTLLCLMRVVLVSATLCVLCGSLVAADTPNIVLIMADDLGYGALGCYGQTKINTPHIDRLAGDGMRFTQAYAGSHVCQPSRSVLMQGLHTGHTAVRANDLDQLLLPEDVTVAELLKEQGYATGGFGKWGLGYIGTTGQPSRQGFDTWFGQYLQVHAHFYYPFWVRLNDEQYLLPGNNGGKRGQYVQDELHAQALGFIRENADGPFFAYLPYIIPHVELVVPEEWEQPYRGKFPKVAIMDPRPGYIGSEDGLTTLAGMISRLDAYVGEVRSLLEELDIADNTLVIFTSDNGGQNGGKDNGWTKMTDFFEANGPLRGYKGTFYEGGMRVPFIVHWPGKTTPNSVSDHICGFQDVLPTFCEIAGADTPEVTDGLSLVPTLVGEGSQVEHRGMYWEYRRGDGIGRAVRMGRWKAVQLRDDGPVELYDLEADVSETTNIAADHHALVREMVAYMDGCHEDEREYPPAQISRPKIDDFVR